MSHLSEQKQRGAIRAGESEKGNLQKQEKPSTAIRNGVNRALCAIEHKAALDYDDQNKRAINLSYETRRARSNQLQAPPSEQPLI